MSKLMNATELAAAIGKTRQTIHNWVADGLPRRKDKLFDLPKVIDWLLERERNAAAMDSASSNDSPALERYRDARARMAELDLATKEGDLIRIDDVHEQWALRVTEVCSGLEFLADRLSSVLPGKPREEVQKIVSDEVWRLRDSYAREGKYCPPPNGDPWPNERAK